MAKIAYVAGGVILVAIAVALPLYYFETVTSILTYSEHLGWEMADALETLYRLREVTIFCLSFGVLGGLSVGYGMCAQSKS